MECKHGTCRNFKVSFGKGGCERSKKPVDSMMSGCENWGELSELKHPAMKRGAMFCGVVTQKSLLDVITEPEKRVLKDKPVLKEKPKGCHEGCKNFSAAQYGTGSCQEKRTNNTK